MGAGKVVARQSQPDHRHCSIREAPHVSVLIMNPEVTTDKESRRSS